MKYFIFTINCIFSLTANAQNLCALARVKNYKEIERLLKALC